MAHLENAEGREFPLDPKQATTLGKSEKASISVEAAKASELHCVIRALKGGGFGLKDLGSQHGTSVNGRQVHAARLRDGDEITVGAARFLYRNAEEEAAAAQPSPSGSPARKTKVGSENNSVSGRTAATRDNGDAELPPGTKLGGYEIQAVLGKGGMGIVYRALQLSLNREVALKVLKSELCEDPDFVRRFTEEARAAGRFNHQNVVQVFDVGSEGGQHFFSMELLQGGTLEERIRREGPLPTSEAVLQVLGAAKGLAYARSLGLVHRDIKPDNLMLTAEGVVKICDLGLASDPSLHGSGKILGTPHFLSPEQARNHGVDHRSDLYSLGCSFYRLLTAKNPYPRKTVREILLAHREAEPPRLEGVIEEGEALDPILGKLLAKDPADRYQTAEELVEDLLAYTEAHKSVSKKLVFGLVGLVAILLATLGYFLFKAPEKEVVRITEANEHKTEMEREIAEGKAESAYLRVKPDLAAAERIAQLRLVAKTHANTRFGKRAGEEAKKLEEAENKRKAREEAKRKRLLALEKRVGDAGNKPLLAGRYSEAWQAVQGAAGMPASRSKELRGIVAKFEQRLEKKVAEAIRSELEGLQSKAEASSTDLDKALAESLARLPASDPSLPKAVTEAIQSARTRAERIVRKARQSRSQAEAKLRGTVLQARRDLFMKKDGCFDRLVRGELESAVSGLPEAAPGLSKGSALAPLWAPVRSFRKSLARAIPALDGVLQAACTNERRIETAKGAVLVRRAAPMRLTLRAEGADASTERTISVFDEPELLAAVLGTSPSGEAKDARSRRRELLTIFGLAYEVPKLRVRFQSLEQGKRTALSKGLPFLSAIRAETEKQRPDKDEAELHALSSLASLVTHWDAGSYRRAKLSAAKLETEHRDSLLATLLGIGTQAAKPRKSSQRDH